MDAEYQALLGSGTDKIIFAADFVDEYGSLDSWKTENDVDSQVEEDDKTDDNYLDFFDDIKESDLPTGYDSQIESTFLKKMVRAGFLPSSRSRFNLPGLEYAPGLRSDFPNSNSHDQQVALDRRLSVKSEERLNKRLRKSNRKIMGIAIKNWQPFYQPHPQIRDKYYHAWVLEKNLPAGFSKTKLKQIQRKPSKQRLKILRDRTKVSDQDVARLSALL